jgi:hypothetical protein
MALVLDLASDWLARGDENAFHSQNAAAGLFLNERDALYISLLLRRLLLGMTGAYFPPTLYSNTKIGGAFLGGERSRGQNHGGRTEF